MNKKMYFAPEMEEQLLEMEGFLCASGDIEDGDPVPVNPGTAGEDDLM
jgi:hypothetical protein